MAFLAIGMVFALVGMVCNVLILIHAFQSSTGEGFLCLCVPCYILYYMFTKFEHPQKVAIIAGALGGGIIGNVCLRMGQGAMGAPGGFR